LPPKGLFRAILTLERLAADLIQTILTLELPPKKQLFAFLTKKAEHCLIGQPAKQAISVHAGSSGRKMGRIEMRSS
jgi:hypothetical protein